MGLLVLGMDELLRSIAATSNGPPLSLETSEVRGPTDCGGFSFGEIVVKFIYVLMGY